MRAQIVSLTLALFFSSSSFATPMDPVASRLAAQNALFEQQYQSDLKSSPETATAYGDYRYNDRLDDRSLAGLSAEHTSDRNFLAHLRAISTTDFSRR